MGGSAPPWFSADYPDLAAKREPFPGVERYQTSYVRYGQAEEAMPGAWEAEMCRRTMAENGQDLHAFYAPGSLPETISLRIIEAPAEFALPVKQDRRLFPCFKVRVEAKHRGPFSLPLTLRAHVLTQQDKEHIGTWVPPEEDPNLDDKGQQRSGTELKGLSCIRHTWEPNARPHGFAQEMKKYQQQPMPMAPPLPLVKPEPSSSSFNGAMGPVGMAGRAQALADSYGMVDSPSLSGAPGAPGGGRNMSNLFGGDRPDPVVTLASSAPLGSAGAGRDSLEAVMESLINAGPLSNPGTGGGVDGVGSETGSGKLVNHMRALQAQQQAALAAEQQAAAQAAALQATLQAQRAAQQDVGGVDRRASTVPGNGAAQAANAESRGFISFQDYEFTNLEFLKPTRMNKVFMVFTINIAGLDDLIYVAFNVPTIGICRAEQREKACKKLNIDFKLLSHFDHAGNNSNNNHNNNNNNNNGGMHSDMSKSLALRTNGPLGSALGGLPGVGPQSALPAVAGGGGGLSVSRLNGGSHSAGSAGDGSGEGSGSASGEAKATGLALHEVGMAQYATSQLQTAPGQQQQMLQQMNALKQQQQQAYGAAQQDVSYQLQQQRMVLAAAQQQQQQQGLANGLVQGAPGSGAGNGLGPTAEFYMAANGSLPPPQSSTAGLGMDGAMAATRKRDQGPKEEENCRFQPVQQSDLPPYTAFAGLTSSDVDMLLPAPHSRMAMRDFINDVYESTGLHRKLTHMDMQALLSQAGFPSESMREHDTISQQQWDEFCAQFRNIVGTLQQVASVWNMEDPVVISGFDMDRAGTINALVNEPAGTFICRFSMSQPGCLVLTCKVGPTHPRADAMGLVHAIIKIDDLHERRVDTWIRDYAGATHLLDVYRCKRVDKRKVFATNYTRLRGLEAGDVPPQPPFAMTPGGFM
ncbi:hypothetical protein CHLRE_12g489150v5 [Chlamydomonas reinhardtii]|uniref:SH2 domain-containing protein n=1 Tax=Chlamydomonas reinhardtii TaxID=3055 RepID=A0A2K3D274_CHLRE|nr:uncharacterized protein CHLRE_12g489150v5 [Chlamydomonas reinhardtii]PNW74638.1 hypothetical protein CHLRE_12g489150v5 [Chlamydomonas reinhardtii]